MTAPPAPDHGVYKNITFNYIKMNFKFYVRLSDGEKLKRLTATDRRKIVTWYNRMGNEVRDILFSHEISKIKFKDVTSLRGVLFRANVAVIEASFTPLVNVNREMLADIKGAVIDPDDSGSNPLMINSSEWSVFGLNRP
jgi:hypothetical protein